MAHPAQKTGSLTATGVVSLGNVSDGYVGWVAVQLEGDLTGSVRFEGKVDSRAAAYVDLAFLSAASVTPGTPIVALTFTAGDVNGIYLIDAKGMDDVRIDCTRTSGTLTYFARLVEG